MQKEENKGYYVRELVKWNYRHVEKNPKCLILNLLN